MIYPIKNLIKEMNQYMSKIWYYLIIIVIIGLALYFGLSGKKSEPLPAPTSEPAITQPVDVEPMPATTEPVEEEAKGE